MRVYAAAWCLSPLSNWVTQGSELVWIKGFWIYALLELDQKFLTSLGLRDRDKLSNLLTRVINAHWLYQRLLLTTFRWGCDLG